MLPAVPHVVPTLQAPVQQSLQSLLVAGFPLAVQEPVLLPPHVSPSSAHVRLQQSLQSPVSDGSPEATQFGPASSPRLLVSWQ
jgi:hypothetical protein